LLSGIVFGILIIFGNGYYANYQKALYQRQTIGKAFEEEYRNVIVERSFFDDEYNKYLDKHSVEKVHNGYFSIDRRGNAIESMEVYGDGSNDVSAYDLIMKDKERLLSFTEPTRFIFSHSALREGWDNPNIFQICTLKHSATEVGKRQEIGRGLRIAVNESGDRMDEGTLGAEFFDINKLTIVASESYDTFAKELQKEILGSLSDRPVKLTQETLKNKVLKNKDGKEFIIDENLAMDLIFDFKQNGYLDKEYKVTEKFIDDVEAKKIQLPEELKNFQEDLIKLVGSVYHTDNFKLSENGLDENIPKELKPNDNFSKKEFQKLWKQIKVKTSYSVKFNDTELVKNSIKAIDDKLIIKNISIVRTDGTQIDKMTKEDIASGDNIKKGTVTREQIKIILGNIRYDIIGEIANKALLTRATAVSILKGINIDSFAKYKANPEDFIRKTSKLIIEEKATTLINNIQYNKIDGEYTDDIFTVNNFSGSLKTNVLEVTKHIYDYVKTDSKIERKFAQDMEVGDEIFIYAKLPHKFKIPTPVGNYNPDWAIVFDTKKVKHIYFIAETKGSMSSMQLKKSEELKIEYAKKHFGFLNSINEDEKKINYQVVDSYNELLNIIA
jgi:type III restriction enzyme